MTTRARNNWIAAILTFLALTLVLPLAAQTPAQLAAGIKARADSIYRLSRSTTIRRQTSEIKALADKVALLPVPTAPADSSRIAFEWLGDRVSYAIRAWGERAPTLARMTFTVDGVLLQTENTAPYCLFGDDGTTCTMGSLGAIPVGVTKVVVVRGYDAASRELASMTIKLQGVP